MGSSNILLTGFGPFGSWRQNPSGIIAESLDGYKIEENVIRTVVLPVSYKEAPNILNDAIASFAPTLVIATGLAGGRPNVAVERFAVNVMDFPFPDENGAQPIDESVIKDGPTAYLANIPLKAVVHAWQRAGICGYISNTAGTFVCNQVFYCAVHSSIMGGFGAGLIHLPSLPAESDSIERPVPTMEIDKQRETVLIAIKTILNHRGADLAFAGGAVN